MSLLELTVFTADGERVAAVLPEAYAHGLAADGQVALPGPDGFESAFLLPAAELAAHNETWDDHIRLALPGLLVIGHDGSRLAIGLDTRYTPSPVLLVDPTCESWEDADYQAPDLASFIRGVREHDLVFGDYYQPA